MKLQDIVAAIEAGDGELQHYLDTKTGEVVLVTDEDQRSIDDDEEPDLDVLPEWHRNAIMQALLVEQYPDRFLPLPDSFDVNEWQIMRIFCDYVANPEYRGELLSAIHGAGAFRFFRATVNRLGLREDWYAYRQEQFESFAREWLTENRIDFRV